MTRPPGWPLGLPPKLAAKYGDAAQKLYDALLRKRDLFPLALDCAIHECERARAYKWPEEIRREQLEELKNSSVAARRAAIRLADHVAQWDGLTAAIRLLDTAARTGVYFKSKKRQPAQVALASFLRALGKQKIRWRRSKNPGHVDSFGPLQRSVAHAIRRRWPSKASVLTLSLAHLFYLIRRPDLFQRLERPDTFELLARSDLSEILSRQKTIVLGGPSIRDPGAAIRNGACWEAAAQFARSVFPHKSEDLASSTSRWLLKRKGQITWIGWRRIRTGN